MKADRRLGLLGLAKRAGAVIDGEGRVIEALRNTRAAIVFLASDAGENIKKKMTDKTCRPNIELVTDYDSDTLSNAIGKTNRMAVAIVEPGFIKAMQESEDTHRKR